MGLRWSYSKSRGQEMEQQNIKMETMGWKKKQTQVAQGKATWRNLKEAYAQYWEQAD